MPLVRIVGGGWRWIVASIVLFFLGTAAGFAAGQLQPEATLAALRPVFDQLAGIGSRVGASPSPVERWWLIYRKNTQAASVLMGSGLLPVTGAIFPGLAMLLNGGALGIVIGLGTRLSPRGADPSLMALAILPHAIFELPALWLVSAWAMRLSLSWLTPGDFERRWMRFKRVFIEAIAVFALAAILLLIAAAIEGNITLELVRRGQSALGIPLLTTVSQPTH
jgi:stage II sporulation protein M